jgi:NAD(P)-dependent dehydrogenase (short-subunit alcohol dehydrogenase family)
MSQLIMLVTGGSRGIGAATAIIGAARGYRVALTYQSQSAAADAVVQTITRSRRYSDGDAGRCRCRGRCAEGLQDH